MAEGRAATGADAPDEREASRAVGTAVPTWPVNALAGDGERPAGAVTGGDGRAHLTSLVTHTGGATVAQAATARKGGEAAAVRDHGPANLAAYARGHWSVENKSHYVRDVTFGEDLSQIRTDNGPVASLPDSGYRTQ